METHEKTQKVVFDESESLSQTQKISLNIKDIAKLIRQQLKKEYPKCVFSIRIERYSMGQSLHINLMKSNFKVIRDPTDIPEDVVNTVNYGRTTIEEIRNNQKENYHQLNQYTFRQPWSEENWNNGVFLTKQAHQMFKRITEIVNHFNYDNSDAMVDYFDVNFYLHLSIGKWNKPYIYEED